MCGPVTGTMALTVAMGAMQARMQQASANRQKDAQARMREYAEKASAKNTERQYGAVLERQNQVREAAAVDMQTAFVESQAAMATARNAAGESGFGQNILDDIGLNVTTQAADHQGVRAKNLGWSGGVMMDQLNALGAGQETADLQAFADASRPIRGVDWVNILGMIAQQGGREYLASLEPKDSLTNFSYGQSRPPAIQRGGDEWWMGARSR